jgi:hypothetical protein
MIDDEKLLIDYVREVGTRFEFFTEQFVQSHVPSIEYCMPDHVDRLYN